ncbi:MULTISPECIES: hypothetical protein [unclassified Bosea (in: a-proteobacteria)]|uniref:hypothetical protein n=1 Tax=unclassified Bosea (in: a-proteobacteria) TaxID=2653178 RepID=UPI000F7595B4|nr:MULTISPECIES: hypothetical protein [unclassified Bosea (in: a-proteobacteria)]AZO78524.1 hypothetical protein BLM15_13530 [Bosea sp. Tri-49]RXT19983.1 hypothetical protein B5U98_18490 [Bosea sp. Tri-39]RXT36855.1 hypothetical protein B5U99_12810 [Bosea sp. Tri-54]
MIQPITAGALAASAIVAFSASLPAGPAAACNRMDGCIHDTQLENYGMMHDGRMGTAMRNGAANIKAFRSLDTTARSQEQPRRTAASRPASRRF